MGPKIGMYSKNWVGQVRFEIFDFLVKVKGLLDQGIFSHFFFFFFFKVVRIRVKPGRSESNGSDVVGGDVIHDVIALGACVSVYAWEIAGAWERVILAL